MPPQIPHCYDDDAHYQGIIEIRNWIIYGKIKTNSSYSNYFGGLFLTVEMSRIAWTWCPWGLTSHLTWENESGWIFSKSVKRYFPRAKWYVKHTLNPVFNAFIISGNNAEYLQQNHYDGLIYLAGVCDIKNYTLEQPIPPSVFCIFFQIVVHHNHAVW